jgi:peptidoglycan biosynthesis protein MviN/MurJ (putative lipid II flippase)
VPEGLPKSIPTRSRSTLRSGLVTGLSLLSISGTAAAVAAILAQKFGHTAATDGFFAAYGVYLVLVLAAQSIRLVVLPDLTRAAPAGRLGAETRAYMLTIAAAGLAVSLLVILLRHPLADVLTGSLPQESADVAAESLAFLVPAAFVQLLAAIAASALAARDDYDIAAIAYAAGGIAGVIFFVLLADAHGPVALAWATVLNCAITFGIPFVALLVRGDLTGGSVPFQFGGRLWRLVEGSAVPIAIQGLFVVSQHFAGNLGVGKETIFTYGYLIASVFAAVTAGSVALVSSAPLTRRGLNAESAAAHVVNASWLSLAVIVAAAGVFALVGPRFVGVVLGSDFTGDDGHQLGHLVVYLTPWMFASVVYTLTFPLVFIAGKHGNLVPVAIGALAVQIPLTWAMSDAFGMPGIAIALAISTLLVVGVLLALLSPRVLRVAAVGLGRLAVVESALAAVSFGLLGLVVGGIPAAVLGLVVYAALILVWRPRGLREAWAYVRALH